MNSLDMINSRSQDSDKLNYEVPLPVFQLVTFSDGNYILVQILTKLILFTGEKNQNDIKNE
jgi:hypothetical protein